MVKKVGTCLVVVGEGLWIVMLMKSGVPDSSMYLLCGFIGFMASILSVIIFAIFFEVTRTFKKKNRQIRYYKKKSGKKVDKNEEDSDGDIDDDSLQGAGIAAPGRDTLEVESGEEEEEEEPRRARSRSRQR
jgi:hypothetical protein